MNAYKDISLERWTVRKLMAGTVERGEVPKKKYSRKEKLNWKNHARQGTLQIIHALA